MSDDTTLLRRYVDEPAEAAFTALVRRHLDLVHAVALRRFCNDTWQAEEMAQTVFSQLAREADPLSRRGMIAAWLYAATLRTAAPNPAAAGPVLPSSPGTGGVERAAVAGESRWDAACDEALDELPEADRTALLLHFFQQRGLPEVGVALNLSDEAARLCVERAVDKLRAVLTRRGNRMGPTALRTLLVSQAAAAAPSGLAERISRRAVAAVLVTGTGEAEEPSFLASLAGMINSGAVLGAAAALTITALLAWGYRTNGKLEAEIQRLRADGQTLAALRRDNRRLAGLVTEAEELRREVADLSVLRAAAFPAGPRPPAASVVLTVTGGRGLRWGQEEVPLEEFIKRIQDFRRRHPAPETLVVVRGVEATFPAIAYVLDEVRKAGITRTVVEGDTRPDDDAGGWF